MKPYYGSCLLMLLLLQLSSGVLSAQQAGSPDNAQPQENSQQAVAPYDLKGDFLGMTLELFKTKHRRLIDYTSFGQRTRIEAPICSDTNPRDRNLAGDPGNPTNGLVNCKLGDSREFGEPGWQPDTIANAPTTDLVFKFVDGLLYEINASFGSFKFEGVKAAFILKFGKPQSSEVASYQNRFGAKYEGEVLFWKNGVTSLILAELSGELDTSRVTFTHDALSRRAKDRRNPKIKPGPDL